MHGEGRLWWTNLSTEVQQHQQMADSDDETHESTSTSMEADRLFIWRQTSIIQHTMMYPLMLACVQHDKDDKQQQQKNR